MKSCPVCKLDYADDFSFCEFDGASLEKIHRNNPIQTVFLSKLSQSNRLAQAIVITFFIAILAMFIFGKSARKPRAVIANQNAVAAVDQTGYILTPQAAQDYLDADKASENRSRKQDDKSDEPEKPGVVVTLPSVKPAKENSQESTQPPATKEKSASKARTVEADEEVVMPPQRSLRATNQPAAIHTSPKPEPTIARAPQSIDNRSVQNDAPPAPKANPNNAIHMNIVRVRSYRTESGIRYDLTFNMQQNDGRVIRWENLQLQTRSQSGIRHSEAIPFYQRLGSTGSLSFTVSIEMRGRSEADFQGVITCTGFGTDVDGRNIKTDFTTRITP